VRDAILARLGTDQGYYVLTAGQFLDAIRAQIRAFFLATWALQLIAAVVGVVGVVNAQLASILDRSTEIAVLRTIGFATRDLTRSVLIECAALGALGAASGVAIGAMVSAQIVTVALRLVTGWRIPFTLSVATPLPSRLTPPRRPWPGGHGGVDRDGGRSRGRAAMDGEAPGSPGAEHCSG
jgi:ABC-type antimicrobial peptide transport system permease subunit